MTRALLEGVFLPKYSSPTLTNQVNYFFWYYVLVRGHVGLCSGTVMNQVNYFLWYYVLVRGDVGLCSGTAMSISASHDLKISSVTVKCPTVSQSSWAARALDLEVDLSGTSQVKDSQFPASPEQCAECL